MKKVYLAAFLACMGGAAHAQISEGGLPWSMSLKNEDMMLQPSSVMLDRPDYEGYLKEDLKDAQTGAAKPYRVAAIVQTDIDLNNSGSWIYLEDGRKIWRLEISVPEALALGFNYDKFNLPEGVSFYLHNKNGRQLLGAYTAQNNSPYEVFANEPVQGNAAVLELDMAAGVSLKDIKFHIDKIYPYYRGAEGLALMYETMSATPVQARPTASSPCHVNANCPAGADDTLVMSKNATVQITMGNSVCSGTMINSTANGADGVCRPFMLTASHCDDNNSREDATFATWLFRFNYQYADCDGTTTQTSQSRTGASFRARSNNPSLSSSTSGLPLVADFLLLELRNAPPATSNAYLAGWNRNTNLHQDQDYYTKFTGFHHPAGDFKKVSVSESIEANGTFNQSQIQNTHWQTYAVIGGTEGGSSGSGLFDIDGLLVGDLSGGPAGGGACAPLAPTALYCKLSYAWENEFDQTAFPQYAGSASRLKDWLDPTNSNTTKLAATKYDCSDYSGPTAISELEEMLGKSVQLYPNPSTGTVNARFNFAEPANLNITVYNIAGARQQVYELKKVQGGNYSFDLSGLPDGIYLFNIETNGASVSKKVVISK